MRRAVPDDGGVDFRSVDVDDGERSVDSELAEHRQCDRQPRQISARLSIRTYTDTASASTAAVDVTLLAFAAERRNKQICIAP